MIYGSGDYRFELVEDWAQRPDDLNLGWIGGVATDSADNVYVFNRGDHPMVIFDPEGTMIATWGDDFVEHAHAIWIDANDHLWLTDQKAHCIWKCDTDGNILDTIGNVGVAGNEGEPFNEPTDIALAGEAGFYVSDGYGNNHIHRFDADGKHIGTWGGKGTGAGEFVLPHCVWFDGHESVWVADRENNRIQVFDTAGKFMDEWTGFRRPADFFDHNGRVYVAELDAGVAILDYQGNIVERFGKMGAGPGQFEAVHGIWLDSSDNMYICEVQRDNGLHKFARV